MIAYSDFLKQKAITAPPSGLTSIGALSKDLFPFQRDIVTWALRRGRAAMFEDCGLGKTLQQLEWARHIPGKVLILAPLAVAAQTVQEGKKFGIHVNPCRSQKDVNDRGIHIANYEMLDHFDPSKFSGIVLDESSILKAYDGKTRTQIIEAFNKTPFRLACTATPAPNDYMELGNHAEFLGVMSRAEMLSTFFVHDGGDTQKWRLKGHAEAEFWKWVCSWAVMLRKPSDLGYDDCKFKLPNLHMHEHVVRATNVAGGELFAMPAATLQERISARRATVYDRIHEAARIIKLSWTENKNAPTTKPTGLRTGPESLKDERDGMPKTRSGSANGARNTDSLIWSRNSSPKENISHPTEKNASHTCGKDTNSKRKKSSSTTESGALKIGTSTGTPTINQNMESDSKITSPSSKNKKEDAPSAGIVRKNLSSITVIQQSKCEACSANDATTASVTSKTTPNESDVPRPILKTQWIGWCHLNSEQDALAKALGDDCVSIYGSLSSEEKEKRFMRFVNGEVSVLLSKPSIFGYGINMQFSCHQVFVGLSDSFEELYQAIRRQWRFGQLNEVNCHVVVADIEGAVVENIRRKETEAARMAEEMVKNMGDITEASLKGTIRQTTAYVKDKIEGKDWTLYLGDCVDLARGMTEHSLHYSIYSPPFASLYTYSASSRDMGNCRGLQEFLIHYRFIVRELYRVTMPGRLTSFHCMNFPTFKASQGYIGIRDFRGALIRMYEKAGWIFHSEVCIWKDPVTAMQRTKALGLLHKQLKKDSCMSRQGIPDYLVTMRKPGENTERVGHDNDSFPVGEWQKYASPIWMDINPNDTLQHRSAREHKDERHICPLQIEVIRRCLRMWSNPGDLVFSPFAGIGSEGYIALQMGRRFVGVELKRSYWEQAKQNLANAVNEVSLLDYSNNEV